MKIGIDFDRVLFRTGDFKDFLDDRIDGFIETYPEKGVYDPELHAKNLGVSSGRILQALERSSDFMYGDLDKLEKLDRHELVLVTRGDIEFQKLKVKYSGILEYIDRVVIVNSGPKDQVDIDLLVDDRKSEIDRVDVEGFQFDREEHSLEDVVEWVKRLEARKSV